MNYILFDPPEIEQFYPFTLTRPLGEMRVFGGTIKELWEKHLDAKVSYLTRSHLSNLYPTNWCENNILINSTHIPHFTPLEVSCHPKPEFLYSELRFPHVRSLDSLSLAEVHASFLKEASKFRAMEPDLVNVSDFFNCMLDFTPFQKSNIDCSSNHFLNDDDGPIIIEEDVTIMEGAMIRGPVHICKGSVIKMGAKIYGPTVIGPYCKIGGEVSSCIFLGYSNKAHEGFLGHSIIGAWCNIGAGTSNSNLKNDYNSVKMWDYIRKEFKDSEQQFLGLYMGDHSKCAINTSFNTGTTVGVNCNIFGSGFPRNYIPSFSWGGSQGIQSYDFQKAIIVAEKVMKRRGVELTKDYVTMLNSVYDIISQRK